MSVTVELKVDTEEVKFGEVLAGVPDVVFNMVRIVPAAENVFPYIWVRTDDLDGFSEKVKGNPAVRRVKLIDRVDDEGLYKVEWGDVGAGLVEGVDESDALVIESHGDTDEWWFTLRLGGHKELAVLYDYCAEEGIDLDIQKVYTVRDAEFGGVFGLTDQQREAVMLAFDRGYFETPSEASLEELGGELGISQQAVSKRVRSGVRKLVEGAMTRGPGAMELRG